MKHANPTSLLIGMSGTLAGLRYRVAGRVVLGMEEGGEYYYWNEFNLINDKGESATLVYEETDSGGEWKLFTLFEPDCPLTAQQAATKRIGDTVQLDGEPYRVTMVDESRVFKIEGEAPEGVAVGDVAKYFNAEMGDKMHVVSWSGDEMEFYRGMDLPLDAVGKAFGFNERTSLRHLSWDDPEPSASGGRGIIIVVALVALLAFVWWRWPKKSSPMPVIVTLAAPRLALGSSGLIAGKTYRISHHEVVAVAEPNRRYEQHEYHVFDGDGNVSRLIYGYGTGAANWFLFREATVENYHYSPALPETASHWLLTRQAQGVRAISPEVAAAFPGGTTVYFDGIPEKISQLFQATIQKAQGDPTRQGAVFYGFKAGTTTNACFAQWNQTNLVFYRGKICSEKNLETLFKR